MIEPRYEVRPIRKWKNTKTGATASIYGAVPYVRDSDRENWTIIQDGYGYWDRRTGTMHGKAGTPRESVVRLLKSFNAAFVDSGA